MDKKVLLKKWLVTLGAGLMFAPAFLFIGYYTMPGMALLCLTELAFALLGGMVIYCMPHKLRVIAILLLALIHTGLCALLCFVRQTYLLELIPYVFSLTLYFFHIRALQNQSGYEYPGAFWLTGVALHTAALLMTLFLGSPLSDNALTVKNAAFVLCMAYFCFYIFMLNEINLQAGVNSERAPSRQMRLRNRLASLLMCAALLLIANLKAITDALVALWDGVIRAVAYLLSLISFQDAPPAPLQAGDSGGGFPVTEASEPSLFAQIMEKIVMALALLALCALALLLLYLLVKTLRRGLKKLLAALRAYMARVSDTRYEETVESLFDWGEVRSALRQKAQTRRDAKRAHIPWQKLDERERVRQAYRLYIKKLPEVSPADTARQTLNPLPKRAADIYDAARYSSRDVAQDEAEYLRQCAEQYKPQAKK